MHQQPTAFDVIDAGFIQLCSGRTPLSLPSEVLAEPAGRPPVVLTEVRRRLLLASTPYRVRDRAVGEAVRRALAPEPEWKTAVAGLLLPGLRSLLGPLTRAFPEWRADLESEAVVGLLAALPAAAPERRRVSSRLIWAGRTQAAKVLTREVRLSNRVSVVADLPGASTTMPRHPDLALLRAEQVGVLSPAEADLIGETRIGRVSLHGYAEAVGGEYGSVRLRRWRAEQKLAQTLPEWATAS